MIEKIMGQHQVSHTPASAIDGDEAVLANHRIMDEYAAVGMGRGVSIQFDQGVHVVGRGLADVYRACRQVITSAEWV